MAINRREFMKMIPAALAAGAEALGKETKPDLNLERGIEHIRSRVMQDNYESSFFSSFGRDGSVKWEVEQQSRGASVTTSVYQLKKIVQKSALDRDQLLVFWHTHPQRVYNEVFNFRSSESIASLASVPPSVGMGHKGHDLAAFMELGGLVQDFKNYGLKLQCCVADALGVWRVTVNSENAFTLKFQELLAHGDSEASRKQLFDEFYSHKQNTSLIKNAQKAYDDYVKSYRDKNNLLILKEAYAAIGLNLDFLDYENAAKVETWEIKA